MAAKRKFAAALLIVVVGCQHEPLPECGAVADAVVQLWVAKRNTLRTAMADDSRVSKALVDSLWTPNVEFRLMFISQMKTKSDLGDVRICSAQVGAAYSHQWDWQRFGDVYYEVHREDGGAQVSLLDSGSYSVPAQFRQARFGWQG